MKKIEPIIIIPDHTAPTPAGFVRTEYGWMAGKPTTVLIRKLNEIIDTLNSVSPTN